MGLAGAEPLHPVFSIGPCRHSVKEGGKLLLFLPSPRCSSCWTENGRFESEPASRCDVVNDRFWKLRLGCTSKGLCAKYLELGELQSGMYDPKL